MGRIIVSGMLVAALFAGAAAAEPETDPARQAELAARFQPFDRAAGSQWAPAFPTPFYRKAAAGGPEAVPLSLDPGSYMVVVLCNCTGMDVTLVGPGGTKVEPIRHNGEASMYSLDVALPENYLTGIDVGDCNAAKCELAVKVYRKKKV